MPDNHLFGIARVIQPSIAFVASMFALAGCLLPFMREVFLAAMSGQYEVRLRRGESP